MKINRIAVTRGPGTACPPDGSGRVLAKGDDDVVAEGLELAAGVAGLATAVGVLGVPVRSEVPVAAAGSFSRCHTITRIDRPTAQPAFFRPPSPGREARRRNRSRRNVSVFAAA